MNNVFLPTFGNRPQQIIGRDTEIAEFMEGLTGELGHPNRATFFIGQRGIGKTALLLELAVRAKREGFITVRTVASEHMLKEIIEGIQIAGIHSTEGTKHPIKGVSAGAFGFSVGLTFNEEIRENFGFRTKLTLLCEELAKRDMGLLFLIDEVRASTAEMREFATTYQYLVGEGMDVAVAMAGLPDAVSSVLNDKILTFLNRAHKVDLGLLPIAEVSIYYAKVFRDQGIHFDAQIIDAAAQATKGYPYLLQLIGYNLVKLLDGADRLTEAMVELAVINSIRTLESDVFAPCLDPLSIEDRRFLKAMSKDLEESRVSDLAERLGVSKSHIQTYRQRLIEADVIHSPSRGVVAFSIPYLGQYLRGEELSDLKGKIRFYDGYDYKALREMRS